MTLLSVFGGGLWIIPSAILLGSLFSFYKAWRNRNSGWEQQKPDGSIISGPEKLPYTEVPAFYFSVILFVFFIIVVLLYTKLKSFTI